MTDCSMNHVNYYKKADKPVEVEVIEVPVEVREIPVVVEEVNPKKAKLAKKKPKKKRFF